MITRAEGQSQELARALLSIGALPIECPVIQIVPPESWEPLDAALRRLAQRRPGRDPYYAWVIFTSVNGVRFVRSRTSECGWDPGILQDVRIAAIGPATARAIEEWGYQPDFIPRIFIAEAIADGLGNVDRQRILLTRSAQARGTLRTILESRGAHVDEVAAYRTITRLPPNEDIIHLLRDGQIDAIMLTSSSTARSLMDMLSCLGLPGDAAILLRRTVIACIGPITAETARGLGMRVDVVASEYTTAGLIRALAVYFAGRLP
jgi:uroporphyrinogen-III synthase